MRDRFERGVPRPAPRARPPVPAIVDAEPWPEPADLARARAAYRAAGPPAVRAPDEGERRHLGWL